MATVYVLIIVAGIGLGWLAFIVWWNTALWQAIDAININSSINRQLLNTLKAQTSPEVPVPTKAQLRRQRKSSEDGVPESVHQVGL